MPISEIRPYSSHNLHWLGGRLPGLIRPAFPLTANPVRLTVRAVRAGAWIHYLARKPGAERAGEPVA